MNETLYDRNLIFKKILSLGATISAKYATNGINITPLSGLPPIDGSSIAANDIVLLKDQTDQTTNGPYLVGAGAWTRISIFIPGMLIAVRAGTANIGTVWELTTELPIVVGTTNLVYTQVGATPRVQSAKACATGNVTSLSGAQTLDGISCNPGDIVFLPFQTTATQNGVYTVQSGTWTGPTQTPEVLIEQGTNFSGFKFFLTGANTYNAQPGNVIAAAGVATSNVSLSGTQTIDGVAFTAGQIILCIGQSTASQNGLYIMLAGAWQSLGQIKNVVVTQGTAGAGQRYYISATNTYTRVLSFYG